MDEQKIVYKKLKEIRPYKNNAKKHSKKQVEQIAESIKQFGFRGVILLDKNNVVIAGHGRCLGAKAAGLNEVPCVYVDDLTEEQIKALRLVDNKVAEGEYAQDVLMGELKELLESGLQMDAFGFELFDGDGKEGKSNEYTMKTGVPQYEVTGEKPTIPDLVNLDKYHSLIENIEKSKLSNQEKKFLKLAATRHCVFNYSKVAEYYANVATKEMQRLMEESALVIIDFDDAIRLGYVELMEGILAMEAEDDEA